MKILQVCVFIDQLQGGAPCSTLGSFMALRSAGIDTEIFALGEGLSSSTKSGFLPNLDESSKENISWIARDQQSSHGHVLKIGEMKSLFLKIAKHDCVVVHQVYGLHSIYVYLFCLITKKPYIVMPHGSLTSYDQRHHRFRKKLANLLFTKNFIRHANSIFVATDIESAQLSKSFKTRSISIVGLGFPKPFKYEILETKKLSDPVSILFMGRITEKKRLDLTIRAIAELKMRQFRVQLTVAGDGPNEMIEKFRKLALDLGVSEFVQFLGWVTGEEKRTAILSADYFVLNSEDENFAVIVPEVQSFGVPVLLTDKVAFSEFVSQHESGVVIQSLEVSSIVQGFEKLFQLNFDTLSENAIKCAKDSEWEEVILDWIARFSQILEDSK